MVMAGYQFMKKPPFHDVYIHGIVRDVEGRKMSKSLGNIVDPIEIIDAYGADALRYSLVSITAEGQDVYISKERFELGRNFANKIWNASRFALTNLRGDIPSKAPPSFSLPDLWIMSRLQGIIEDTTRSLDRYRFNEAASALYEFFWHAVCDWYLELVKPKINERSSQWVLREVLAASLKLLHPLMPFITEEISSLLHPKRLEGDAVLARAPWPTVERKWIRPPIEHEMLEVIRQIQAIRNVRTVWRIDPTEKVDVCFRTKGKKEASLIERSRDDLSRLARLGEIRWGRDARPPQSVTASTGKIESYVLLKGLVDIELETRRIRSQIEEAGRHAKKIEDRLGESDFVRKAPPWVVEKDKERLTELRKKKMSLEGSLASLKRD